ncbi:porin family protein [Hymenobacter psoromatis]|uniref:porin family protein n=1 Tax=Hymenobacter psoromatis TaxID=1484116 RepID=UPI001CBD9078|nr:porin family protein [Hymenobacter psoromatis]
MKQIILFTLSALAIPVLSHAQAGQPVRFGLKAGASLSSIAGKGTNDYPVSPLAGGVGGMFATVPLGTSQRWFLQPELLYSQQGFSLSHPATNYNASFRSDYLKLPVLLGFTRKGFFAAVGPQVGYLVRVRNTYRFPDYSQTGGASQDIIVKVSNDLRYYQRWEFSAVAAVGYRWQCGAGIELRYSDTFFNQSHDNLTSNYGYPQAHSLSGQVQASYVLPWH